MSAAGANAAVSGNTEKAGARTLSTTLYLLLLRSQLCRASEELILRQIKSIRDSINSDKSHYKVDTSPPYQLLPSLFQQLQKNRTPKIVSEVFIME